MFSILVNGRDSVARGRYKNADWFASLGDKALQELGKACEGTLEALLDHHAKLFQSTPVQEHTLRRNLLQPLVAAGWDTRAKLEQIGVKVNREVVEAVKAHLRHGVRLLKQNGNVGGRKAVEHTRPA